MHVSYQKEKIVDINGITKKVRSMQLAVFTTNAHSYKSVFNIWPRYNWTIVKIR